MATGFFQEWKTKPLVDILAGRIRAYYNAPGRQDPWPKEIDLAVKDHDALMVCHHCFMPQENPSWFCPECGSAVGPYNNTMEYLYIFSIGEAVRSGVGPEARFTKLTVPGYILMGLMEFSFFVPVYYLRLFLNWRKINRTRTKEGRQLSPDVGTQPEGIAGAVTGQGKR